MAGWKLKAIIVTAVAASILQMIFQRHFKCNMSSVLKELCSAYDEGHVSGPLCSDLCEQNNIRLVKCLTTVPDKKIYDGTWHGKSVILKVNMSWFEEFKERQKITDNDVASSYQSDVSSRVNSLFGNCSQCTKLVSRLLLLGDGNSDGSVTAAETRTFISLLQHMEPMMLMTLNESKHTVDFYGYCGGLYMVEKVPFVASDLFGDSWELIELPFLPDTLEKPIKRMCNYYGGKVLSSAAFFLSYTSTIVNDTLTFQSTPFLAPFRQTCRVNVKNSTLRIQFSMQQQTCQ